MLSRKHFFLACVLSLVLAFPARPYAGGEVPGAFYIAPENLLPSLLVPPPAEGSMAQHKQIQAVIAAQKHITAADRVALRDEQHMRIAIVTEIMGDDFSREHKPKTFALLDHVMADARSITEADKNYWHIRRPYLCDAHVKLLVDPINASPAYPSGHTAESRVIAEVLGLLYPDKLAALRMRAEAIAWHRVEAGVHYPADLESGRMLAMLIMGGLMQNDDFRRDLESARAEVKSVD